MKRLPKLAHDRLGFEGISLGAIRHWRIVMLAALGLIVVGLMSWQRIPRLEDPAIEPELAFVTIPYPGASPEIIESQVLRPIEESETFSIEGVESVESTAYPNYAQMKIRFEPGTSMDTVVETMRGKAIANRKLLPAGVGEPLIKRAKSATFAAQMVLIVAGNRSDAILADTARHIEKSVRSIPGVGSVLLRGARQRAIRVRLDPLRLANQALSVATVSERIRAANVRISGGEVEIGDQTTLLAVTHEITDAASVGQIMVGASSDGTRTVRLADVAEVSDDYRPSSERMLHEGSPAVGLEVRFRAGENAVQLGKQVHATLDVERKTLPAGLRLDVAHDQPEWVGHSLSALVESLLEGIALVMLVITLGIGWRAALVVAFVLPLALAGALIGLYSMGFALEQVSIAGLIIALGLLVDDAVVVTESVQLMRDRGLSAVRAAVLGTARVFWANNGTTAVACASFLPLFFMGGDTGSFIRGLPVAVILCLVTSLFVAQLLTPWISTFLLKRPTLVAPIADGTAFDRKEDLGGDEHGETNRWLRVIKHGYAWCIPRIIARPYRVIGVATALLLASCALLPKVGVQFFPKADKPVLFVTVDFPPGTDNSITARKVSDIVTLLRKEPDVASTSAVLGGAYPSIFIGRGIHASTSDFADIKVALRSSSSDKLTGRLRASLANIPGVRTTVEELYHGPPVPHPIAIRIEGDDYETLQVYAEKAKAKLRAVPGAINVTDTMAGTLPITNIEVDGDRAMRLGVTASEIGMSVRSLYGGDTITSFRRGSEMVEIVIEGTRNDLRDGSDALGDLPIPTLSGHAVPVEAIGHVSLTRGFPELRRRNARRVVEVVADVAGAALPADILKQAHLESIDWPQGYRFGIAGEQAETEKGFRNLGIAAIATLLIIFVLLVLMFGSLTRAAIVLAAVPFVLIGAVFGLYVTGTPFGFMAFLGLIALIGVYVNHKIYFVDRAQELIQRGMPWEKALYQAGIDRLRPVVLTALTATLGLLPLTLGGGVFWTAFGWVNIFGLATSIPLSLLVLPAFLAAAYKRRAPTVGAAHTGQDLSRSVFAGAIKASHLLIIDNVAQTSFAHARSDAPRHHVHIPTNPPSNEPTNLPNTDAYDVFDPTFATRNPAREADVYEAHDPTFARSSPTAHSARVRTTPSGKFDVN
jgi:multidrug efflux pump subunit AcrB